MAKSIKKNSKAERKYKFSIWLVLAGIFISVVLMVISQSKIFAFLIFSLLAVFFWINGIYKYKYNKAFITYIPPLGGMIFARPYSENTHDPIPKERAIVVISIGFIFLFMAIYLLASN